MGWINKRKQATIKHEEIAEQSSIEVVALKRKTNKTAKQTSKNIDRLNKLLKANGITLKIHIATKGGHYA